MSELLSILFTHLPLANLLAVQDKLNGSLQALDWSKFAVCKVGLHTRIIKWTFSLSSYKNSIDTRHHVTINCTLPVIHRVVKQPAVVTYSNVIHYFSVFQRNEAAICWPDWEIPTGTLLLFWHRVHYLYSFHKSLRKFANPLSVFVFVDCVFPSCPFQLPLQRHHSYLYLLASTNNSSLIPILPSLLKPHFSLHYFRILDLNWKKKFIKNA